MPVPSAITDLSTTPASNSPAGSEAPTEGDNHLRTAYSFIRSLFDTKADSDDLASGTAAAGAGLVGFDVDQSYGAGTAGEALRIEVLGGGNVRHYGVDPANGATANAIAMNVLLANVDSAGGGDLWMPPGTYDIAANDLEVLGDNISITGCNQRATLIRQNTLNERIFTVDGGRFQLRNIGLTYNGTPLAGGRAAHFTANGINSKVENIVVYSCYDGFTYLGSGQELSAFEILNYESFGLLAQGVSDLRITGGLINAGNTTRGVLGGIRLVDKAEAVQVANVSILSGKYSITTTSAAYAEGNRPAYNKFLGVFFDAAAEGSQIADMVESTFGDCWFSGGRSGGGFDGLSVGRSDSLRFRNTSFFNCGYSGVTVGATAKRATFNGCSFQANSVTAGSGVGRGIEFAAGTTDFVVQGCSAANNLYTGGQQGYGIVVATGASDRYVVADNLVTGNVTGGVFDGGSGVNKRVANNY
jgi:hypothetical protein